MVHFNREQGRKGVLQMNRMWIETISYEEDRYFASDFWRPVELTLTEIELGVRVADYLTGPAEEQMLENMIGSVA